MALNKDRAILAAACAALWVVPALGQPRPPAKPEAKKIFDPNEILCEKQQVPGSRLDFAKVCHTRAEWSDLRNQDRQDIDRAQTLRSIPH